MQSPSCIIKNLPPNKRIIVGNGNRGGGFPVSCTRLILPPAQDCYLVLEQMDGPTFVPFSMENQQIDPPAPFVEVNSMMFAAPCIESLIDSDCYIALEENGITPIDLEETDDYFSTDCINN